jgi:hypothetical protein
MASINEQFNPNLLTYVTIYNTSSWNPSVYYKNGENFEPFPLLANNINKSYNPVYDIITIHRVNFEPANLIMFVDDISHEFDATQIHGLKNGFSISGEAQFSLHDGLHFLIYNNGSKLLSIRQGHEVGFDNDGNVNVFSVARDEKTRLVVNSSKVQSWVPDMNAKHSHREINFPVTIINSSNWNPQILDVAIIEDKTETETLEHHIVTRNEYKDVTPYFPALHATVPVEFPVKTHRGEIIAHKYVIENFKGLKIKFTDHIPKPDLYTGNNINEENKNRESLLLPPSGLPPSTLIENGTAEFSLQNGRVFYIHNDEPKMLKITQYNSVFDVANELHERSNLTQGWVPDINATLSPLAKDNLCKRAQIVTIYNTSSWILDVASPSINNTQNYRSAHIINLPFGPVQTLVSSFKIRFSDCLTFNKNKYIANSCEFLLSNGLNFNVYDLGEHICVEQIESGIVSCWVPDLFAKKFV